MNRLLFITLMALVSVACSGSSDNAHTTATTIVPPPPRQVLRLAEKLSPKEGIAQPNDPKLKVDPKKPLLILNLPNVKTFREGEPVVIDFSLANVELKGDGGAYRVRYIVDDEEMQWIDSHDAIGLTGWTPGKHTIRIELVGPDGWPYRNGDYNIVTREITVVK